MPLFVHQALLWGLLIVSVPVVIHLINMLRHRRVEWAAMEFLLISQKKHRTWIILKQLLLLLMRMLAIATVVLLVAQPLLQNRFGEWFGSTQTHHILLVDDSFSMSDRWADTSGFAEAKTVIKQIGDVVAREQQPQTFTLLRFSRVAQLDRGTQPDMLKQPVNRTEFPARLDEVLGEMEVSQSSAGLSQAIQAIGQLLGEAAGERRIVYLISDFRAREWDNPTELRTQLAELNEAEAEIHLINCIDRQRPNLAITALAPAEGIRAAGVPWPMEAHVHNYGTTPAKQVSVLLEVDGHERPGVTVAEIPPGGEVKEPFPVFFPNAGPHQVVARLETDAVAVDNFRYSVIDLPLTVPVLLVDNPDARDARYVDVASAPGAPVRTGVSPQIETPRYLNTRPLDEFQTITLMNFERLDRSAIEALERYITAGGGVAVFLGERCTSRFINDELYRDGAGFFPVPLAGQETLMVDRLERAPDLQVGTHPIFRVLAGKRNSFISMVIVERYFAVREDWQPEPDSTTRVIARLRNRAPFAVERRFGEGRVVAFLTTAAPVWNNWARNPSFVVAMQDMHAYLSRRPSAGASRQVGTRLSLELNKDEYQQQVSFFAPTEDAVPAATIDAVATKTGTLAVSFSETDTSGIFEARLTKTVDGAVESRRYAFNVDGAEGNLKALSGPQLAPRLEGVDYEYRQAAAFQYAVSELAGYNVSRWLLYLLVLLLIGEQILAWSASYHPARRDTAAAAKGGVR